MHRTQQKRQQVISRKHIGTAYSLRVQLNYHHLRYFWAVVREGSVTRAAARLHVSQPTVSEQLRELEQQVGERLLERRGTRLVLTEVGTTVFRYAEEIFALGEELSSTLEGRETARSARLAVGLGDVVPKAVAAKVLAPALALRPAPRMVCFEDRTERLLDELAAHTLDLVIDDAPARPGHPGGLYSHLLVECPVAIVGTRELAARYTREFPSSLHGAPMLLPVAGTAMRRSLDHWMVEHEVRPVVVAEFQDSALMTVFGQQGQGLLAAPSVVLEVLERSQGLHKVGTIGSITERYFAIVTDRRRRHPALSAVLQQR